MPANTTTAAPQPTQVTLAPSGHRFVVSIEAKSKYYCETDSAWKGLKESNLRWYDSEEALRKDYPNLTLNMPCG